MSGVRGFMEILRWGMGRCEICCGSTRSFDMEVSRCSTSSMELT
jgi:hypothetical protein